VARNLCRVVRREAGLSGALTSRAEAHVLRLACIYALMDESRVVRLLHLKAAIAVWEYCEASVLYLFGQSIGDPVADQLLTELQQHSEGMTRTEISHHFGKHIESNKLDSVLGALADAGKLVARPQRRVAVRRSDGSHT